jgi:DNA topoisomerase I
MKVLVIVESPSKCKTISKYLSKLKDGHTYTVIASFGHIRDLNKKDLGIDIENGFKPNYQAVLEKNHVMTDIGKHIKNNDFVLLATDFDREGESIAWHIKDHFKLAKSKYDRITFTEITPTAIQKAVASPRKLDMNLIAAQQARRILDRLVGFKITPILWKHFKTESALKLSAGRVQSATMKLIVDREKEVSNHSSHSYWSLQGVFNMDSKVNLEDAKYYEGNTIRKFEAQNEVKEFFARVKNRFTLAKSKVRRIKESPSLPFITSTLQQESSGKLGFAVKYTMQLAQALYEHGIITYMRTDSYNLSKEATAQVHQFITATYDSNHVCARASHKKSKGAQEAHEAIRPTDIQRVGLTESKGFTKDHDRLYQLIWKRTVASQMIDAQFEELEVDLRDAHFETDQFFRGKVRELVEPGYLLVYGTTAAKDAQKRIQKMLQDVQNTSKINCKEIRAKNTWTSPPPRFSEATLIKLLEKEGIGRPSTYVGILGKLLEKQYVMKQNVQGREVETTDFLWSSKGGIKEEHNKTMTYSEVGKLVPTPTGLYIDTFLRHAFPDIVDSAFTTTMEEQLDSVADGDMEEREVLNRFWTKLSASLGPFEEKTKGGKSGSQIPTKKIQLEQSKNEIIVDGKAYIVRMAKYGPVIQSDDKYWGLKHFLKYAKKAYTDITEADIRFVAGFPYALPMQAELMMGPYGVYVKKDGENFMIPSSVKKKYNQQWELLTQMTSKDVDAIVQAKADYKKEKEGSEGSKEKKQSRKPKKDTNNKNAD